MKNRVYIKDLKENIGENITLAGWVDSRRDHGKLIFIDLRDETGNVQMVALPNHKEAHQKVDSLRSEWVVKIEGKVNERPEKMVNDEEPNGDIEIEILEVEVLSEAATPPFDPTEDTMEVDESVRLKYRYVDLRSARMQKNLRLRSDFIKKIREHLFFEDFVEIETPYLTKATPEGSRDFIVPSRHKPGSFYALPQSPQQYKQLLMGSGFEKYFQIARAMRDEDLRADRGFEHTQIDIEMAFVDREEVMSNVEKAIINTVEDMGYTIKEKPFPKITYEQAMEKFGEDKFDLRDEDEKQKGVLAYSWVIDFPFFEKTDEGGWTFTHNPFSMPKEEHLEWLMEGKNIDKIMTQQYDLVCNGFEAGGGSIRAHKPEILSATYKIMGYNEEQKEGSIGHILDAFKHGIPPHGGIALGVERNIMNLTGEEYLREVQAFPMTRGGQTSVMNAPGEVPQKQLDELGIQIKKNE